MNKADELRQIAEANEADGLDAIANGIRTSADTMDKMAELIRELIETEAEFRTEWDVVATDTLRAAGYEVQE